MTREQALGWVRIHAYHDRIGAAQRIYLEHRISRAAYDQAVETGRRQRQDGMPCACHECQALDERIDAEDFLQDMRERALRAGK